MVLSDTPRATQNHYKPKKNLTNNVVHHRIIFNTMNNIKKLTNANNDVLQYYFFL